MYPEAGATLLKVREFASVGSASSSSEKFSEPSPGTAMLKAKSCGSFGRASFVTVMLASFVLTQVQVTVSPGATSMFDTGLPSLHVALVWSHPGGSVSASE